MNLSNFDRWFRIIKSLEQRARTKREILDLLQQEEIRTSPRTFDRDLEDLRTYMSLDVTFNRSKGKYYLRTDEENGELAEAPDRIRLLERLASAGVMSEKLTIFSSSPHLRLDPSQVRRGVQYLDKLLLAAKHQVVVRLIYRSFKREAAQAYTFEPGLITEWGNRWYVLGYHQEEKRVRQFALDRIESMQDTSRSRQGGAINYRAMMDTVYGVTINPGPVEEVTLCCTEHQAHYLDTKPLHPSQTEAVCERPGHKCFQFQLVPNYEFVHEVMRLGAEVEVLAPATLRAEVAAQLEKTLEKYTTAYLAARP